MSTTSKEYASIFKGLLEHVGLGVDKKRMGGGKKICYNLDTQRKESILLKKVMSIRRKVAKGRS